MFQEATQRWFDENFPTPTPVQQRGWERIADGRNALLVAPTGSGKTLAAFLAGIDRLGASAPGTAGVRILYVSPLKALVYDIERNLQAPLAGIARVSERLELPFRQASVAVRTGDTPQRERQKQARHPAEILVTTPESLYLMLGSRAAETLAAVETVIVDEIHALADTKRGAHLALSLERLAERAARDPQRIGLSATVRPLDAVAAFLGGDRDVEIVDCSAAPRLDLTVTVPVPDMQNPPPAAHEPSRRGGSILGELHSREVGTPPVERGIWPLIYPELLAAIRANRSTIVFVNSRGLCERLAFKLNELAGEELVRAHHGSVSHEKRADIEEGLKSGVIRGIVATSSLELGIDMGAVDLVLLVESPGSVARGLQRVGRAGHGVGELSTARLYPKFRGDLLESTVVAGRMLAAEIDAIRVPANVLDVLAQQVVAMCCERPRTPEEIARIVKRAWNYRELPDGVLAAVLDMLSGRYPSSDFADLRPLLSWDRAQDLLSPRRGAALVARLNAGTIPDRGAFGVHLGEGGPRVGELDEEMVFETRPGDNVTLGASTWRVEEITRDRVVVTPAPGEPGRLPFWRGDGPGRSIELGRALGEFLRRLAGVDPATLRRRLAADFPLDDFAARNLADYLTEQQEVTGTLPTDRAITVERFRDELGDWRVCILTPFGARVHAPWAMALQRTLGIAHGFEMQLMYTDDGIVLRFADVEELPALDALFPDPDEVEEHVTAQLPATSLFAGLFRENAVRSLLLRRNRPGQRSPLWAQRLKAQNLLATVQNYPGFPIVMETYRQALADVFDLPALRAVLADIRSRAIRVDDVETRAASPFARSLVFAYVAAYLYAQYAPLAERKAQALTLDQQLLNELLGQAELRELIDAAVLAELEAQLQYVAEDFRARDVDELHDVLRRLGDLDAVEMDERCESDASAWLAALAAQRRAARVRVAGEERWIASEDAGLYRDALGIAPPAGIPDAFLATAEGPLETLAKRYARHHGPFLTEDLARRYGLRSAQVTPVLEALEAAGVLLRGEIRPGGVRLEWCDAEVLRRLRRRNLARLRDEVAAVDGAALAIFLPAWHGLDHPRGGTERLREAVARLQDLALPWSLLVSTILPARVANFRPEHLDLLAASGAVVWVGRSARGVRDGRIALYLREQVRDLLVPAAEYAAPGPLHTAVLERLGRYGASFLVEIEDHVRGQGHAATSRELRDAMWDLVWAGQITNDTFAPLNDLAAGGPRQGGRMARGAVAVAGGRWSLVANLATAAPDPTRQALARATLLLDRYGIVSRQCAQAENLPGGFGPLYKVCRKLEEQGRVRRGHFVDGLPSAQFAWPGAVDRLRASKPATEERDRPVTAADIAVLATTDPVNPYGALIPWPAVAEAARTRLRRIEGSWVVLARGRPVLYVGSRGSQLVTFPESVRDEEGALEAAIEALRRLPKGATRRLLVIETIDGESVGDSPHLATFRQSGFANDYRGLVDTRPSGGLTH